MIIDLTSYADDSALLKHVKTLMLLPKLWECQPKSYLNGLRIIKWKAW